jgi:hypothetical protein
VQFSDLFVNQPRFFSDNPIVAPATLSRIPGL